MPSYEKPDFWSLKAKKEGYPARSVYKLQELDEKFRLLPRDCGVGFKVLDLGAAPGSWSLYILRKLGSRVILSAVDPAPLSRQYDRGLFDGENLSFIRGDMTDPGIQERILSGGPYNLVLSDAAPATTGNRSVDTLRSHALAEAVLDYGEQVLGAGGNIVVKIFQGGDMTALQRRLRESFNTGKSFKPRSCRPGSFETYYIGLGKRQGPSVIDPRRLVPF
ncbi:MAG: RlmE family RNA methyltransferase [Spirochaetaceae bacterium]|jgi:23S rRNA (uridine2552-2'-O)-methyltransferase|nr:RlmE family RNA methyltransferase [Spirochaetaceae bacterium]